MDQEPESPPSPADRAQDRQEDIVWWAIVVGEFLSLVAAADGLIMMLRRREAACSDGKYFPEGTTDFRCFAHPQFSQGLAVLCISLVLGLVLALAGFVALSIIRSRRESPVS